MTPARLRLARSTRASLLLAAGALAACEDKAGSSAEPAASASPPSSRAAPSGPRGNGCARTGSLEAVANDPSCVVLRASEEAMRDLGRRVTIELASESPVVVGGSGATLRLTITNVAATETTLLFDAYTRAPGPRTDWSRLAGVPDMKPPASDAPRLHFVISTLDAFGHDVDGVPTVAGTDVVPTPASVLAVRLRPGGKLTEALSWWALRIPPPPPIVTDDAGHRFVPKTLAVPLLSGDYTISVELPLHGLAPRERTVTTQVHVDPAPKVPKPPKPKPTASEAAPEPDAPPATTPRGPPPSPPVLRPPVP